MSDLRVTDVQAALRHFAGLGHDILTDPRAVHLDGQRYGLAVGHSLTMHHSYSSSKPENTSTYLTTHLMQSERPLLSKIETLSHHEKDDDMDKAIRIVGENIPHRNLNVRYTNGLYIPRQDFYRSNSKNEYIERSYAPMGISPLWTPDSNSNTNALGFNSAHEALKAHTSPDFKAHPTIVDQDIGRVNGQSNLSGLRPMLPEEFRDFNHQKVLSELVAPGQPFKGLVTVSHKTVDDYVYNPETEQLLKV